MNKYINPYKLFVGSFIPNWLMNRKEITSTEKLLYARLSQYAGKNGYCYPKQETLAKEIGLKVDAINKSLKNLINHNLIESKRQGLGKPNTYRFLYHTYMDSIVQEPDSDTDQEQGFDTNQEPDSSTGDKENHLRESLKENHTKEETTDCLVFRDLWNSECEDKIIKPILSLSTNRRQKIKTRLKERPFKEWNEVFRKINSSEFCCGDNDRGWSATFDWIIKNEENAIKVLEGKYDNKIVKAGKYDHIKPGIGKINFG
jgi:hypothetical protein